MWWCKKATPQHVHVASRDHTSTISYCLPRCSNWGRIKSSITVIATSDATCPPPLGRDEPSDHIPISLAVLLNKGAPPQKGPAKLVWDLAGLRSPNTLARYRTVIQTLTEKWMRWRDDLVEEWKKASPSEGISRSLLVTILYEGLLFVLNSAAYQTLNKKLVRCNKRQPYLSPEVFFFFCR